MPPRVLPRPLSLKLPLLLLPLGVPLPILPLPPLTMLPPPLLPLALRRFEALSCIGRRPLVVIEYLHNLVDEIMNEILNYGTDRAPLLS